MRWLASVLDRPFRFLVRLIFTPILFVWMIGAMGFGAMLGALAGFFLSILFFEIPPGQSAWELVIYIPCMIGGSIFGFQYWRFTSGADNFFGLTGDSHGSARFASRKELKKLVKPDGLLIGQETTGQPGASYNPLDRLTATSLDLGEDATTLADALVMDPPGQVQEAHWNEEAKAILSGLIMFCVAHEERERRNLATVREYLTLPPDREAASVLSNAQRHTHFLDSPRIAGVISRSDFHFAELQQRTVSVFLVLPPNRLDAYSRWLRLLISQALQDIARHAEAPQAPTEPQNGAQGASGAAGGPEGGKRAPTLFLLDEFAALGRLEAIELMAGYGLQLWPILQDMSQLNELYGKRASTFVANAGVQQVFGVNDLETAQWLSKMIGQETTGYQTQSYKPGDAPSMTQNVTGRDLLTPDEIMQMPPDLQLLRVQGKPTALARKLRYYADPEFKGLFQPQDP